MDINTIYSTIFPIGGIDDNNKYAELTGDKISTVQVLEPALGVSEFILSKQYTYDKNNIPYKYAYRIPLVSIENYIINPIDLTAFNLDYTGFLPTLSFEFVDSANKLLSTNVPKDGSIIRVYIGGQGDEMYYKPIRQDFVMTSIRKIGSSNLKYRAYGKLNVPYGYRKEAWCGGQCTAMQALFNLAVWTGLGFATNFTNMNTLDSMNWRNNETGTYFDFMEDITAHACYSPNTFFTSFIDQYNVLNFVECHSLLSHGGKKTDVPSMVYKCYPPQTLPKYNEETDGEKTPENQLPLKKGDDPFYNQHQRISYYYISNHDHFKGWSNYIESYQEISNGNSALSDGFKTHVNYSDSNVGDWGFNVCDFLIRPIDNLKRDSMTQKIESLPDEVEQNTYIPLNLMQMSKSEYLEEQSSVDNMTNVESFHNFGEIDSSNTFKQYYFAEIQNRYQMKCLKKCGLKVKLQNYNPAITKFSRLWVDIYDDHPVSNYQLQKLEVKSNEKGDYKRYKEERNDNIISYDDEGLIDEIKETQGKNYLWPFYQYNRGLSGWYVVTEIDIEFVAQESNLKMNLLLNRIEYQPNFKDEYNMAKKAVNKYKEENIFDDFINTI